MEKEQMMGEVVKVNKEEKKTEVNNIASIKRSFTLDNFRGFIILMLALNSVFAKFLSGLPAWFGHANFQPPQTGIYLADFGAPMFMLIMAFSFIISYNKSKAEGNSKGKYLRRNLSLIGIGAIYILFNAFLGIVSGGTGIFNGALNVLIIYGLACIFALPFAKLKPTAKAILGLILILAYQALLFNGTALYYTTHTEFGGIIGSIGWAGYFLIACSLGELFFINKKKFFIFFGVLAGVVAIFTTMFFVTKDMGNALTTYFTLNRLMYSAYYLLLTLFTSVCVFLVFELIASKKALPFFTAWGQSSLFFYLYGYMLYFICLLLPKTWLFYGISLAFMLIAMMIPARIFEKKKIRINL